MSTLQSELWRKFQGQPGEANHQAKLSTEGVENVRILASLAHWSDTQIAEHSGIPRGTIFDITSGRTWRHV